MTSIYEQVLGPEAFSRLHPKIQQRFGFSSADRLVSTGRGAMQRIWHGSPLVKPFLAFGTRRNIMFPEQGENVPFQVTNYAYRDQAGREFVTWVRTFEFPAITRRFDAYMAADPGRRWIVDYFGTHAHYASDLKLSVSPEGGMQMTSAAHYFLLGGRRIPFPELLAGRAHVVEWYDDAAACYRIRVRVINPVIGLVLGYEGTFQAEFAPAETVPIGCGTPPALARGPAIPKTWLIAD